MRNMRNIMEDVVYSFINMVIVMGALFLIFMPLSVYFSTGTVEKIPLVYVISSMVLGCAYPILLILMIQKIRDNGELIKDLNSILSDMDKMIAEREKG